jgi:periplasmic divalent cation tolerance protein
MQPDTVALILTTWPANRDASAFAATLVEEGLAACVNVLPAMESTYRWKDKIEREAERQVLIKTTAALIDAVRERVHSLHPYEVPEFLVLAAVQGSPAYLDWVRESTHRAGASE